MIGKLLNRVVRDFGAIKRFGNCAHKVLPVIVFTSGHKGGMSKHAHVFLPYGG